ncbi:hypothetical protein CERZMDRAFT_83560 [Cercospora zeae-maydis SCOH1-5]|uniref:Uncharacterized protein n=1 Tax=Cercospora zeae-maydis SCOH1-5 TaxID=717836 RepID=A0A6A6FIV9_9PEZI|nr:hypothetical protein CERZMDRAFT_83560 [Cercospora zeae-maydis SCOH1-5]
MTGFAETRRPVLSIIQVPYLPHSAGLQRAGTIPSVARFPVAPPREAESGSEQQRKSQKNVHAPRLSFFPMHAGGWGRGGGGRDESASSVRWWHLISSSLISNQESSSASARDEQTMHGEARKMGRGTTILYWHRGHGGTSAIQH